MRRTLFVPLSLALLAGALSGCVSCREVHIHEDPPRHTETVIIPADVDIDD